MELQITKTLVVSIGHITEEEGELLEKRAWHPRRHFSGLSGSSGFISTGFGWRIYVGTEWDYPGFSRELHLLAQLAIDNDCIWLEFDSDGPKLEGFAYYDW